MTPTRSRTTLVALLVTFAVASGVAGTVLLTAAPAATGADAGRVPGTIGLAPRAAGLIQVPRAGEPRRQASGAAHPGELAPRPPEGEPSRRRRGEPRAVHSPGGRRIQPAAPTHLLIGSAGLRALVAPVGRAPTASWPSPTSPARSAGGSGAPGPATATARPSSPATSTRPAAASAP